MFGLVSGIYDAYLAPTQLNVLMVGPSSVGKTALLERIKVTQCSSKSVLRLKQQQQQDGAPNVPVHWLKLTRSNRSQLKQIPESSSANRTTNNDESTNNTAAPPARKGATSTWLCPAPSRYAQADYESQEDDDDNETDDDVDDPHADDNSAEENHSVPAPPSTSNDNNVDAVAELGPIPSPMPMRKIHSSRTDGSMDSVDLTNNQNNNTSTNNNNNNPQHPSLSMPLTGNMNSSPPKPSPEAPPNKQPQPSSTTPPPTISDYDLKPKSKMLPLTKIRRTIGMNLAKVAIHGCQCHFWDLGGRMHELWERYYVDADAVVFVWKTPPAHPPVAGTSERSALKQQMALQQELLDEVRSCIPDDVPFLILAHDFREDGTPPPTTRCPEDILHSTARLLPHYHNPYQGLFFVNAATGKGVKAAMDWLIPLAKQTLKWRADRPVEDFSEAEADK